MGQVLTAWPGELTDGQLFGALDACLGQCPKGAKKVLLLPPDFTRFHSGAGRITAYLYRQFTSMGVRADVLPALGTHAPVTEEQQRVMFPGVPRERFLVHRWREDVVRVGEVPSGFVREVSEGLMTEPIPVEINRRLLDPSYDWILSIGQVVPHEVVGMANRNKNLFVGLGGSGMINASHILGALYGMERIMGRDHSPVRQVFDWAEAHFLAKLPLTYLLTVTTEEHGRTRLHGLFIGRERSYFEQAVALSQQCNVTTLPRPVGKMVVYLDPEEFHSTWLGNKAVYRTRMAIEDGGELVILAPGVQKFGEDEAVDRLIRKYGYRGREAVLAAARENGDLRANLSAAAHLIHGSSEGRFAITYCPVSLTEAEVRQAGYGYCPYAQAVRRYDPASLRPGWNTLPDGEEIYYIPNPALGLWRV